MSVENDALEQRAKDNAFSIEEVETNPKAREVIERADFLFGYNLDRDKLFLLYGHETLNQIANKRFPKDGKFVVAAIKYRENVGQELEFVYAISLALKGSYAVYEHGKVRIVTDGHASGGPLDDVRN